MSLSQRGKNYYSLRVILKSQLLKFYTILAFKILWEEKHMVPKGSQYEDFFFRVKLIQNW